MRINVEKCKVRQIKSKRGQIGILHDIEEKNLKLRDLDVIVASDLKRREHVYRMVGKTNRRLGYGKTI